MENNFEIKFDHESDLYHKSFGISKQDFDELTDRMSVYFENLTDKEEGTLFSKKTLIYEAAAQIATTPAHLLFCISKLFDLRKEFHVRKKAMLIKRLLEI